MNPEIRAVIEGLERQTGEVAEIVSGLDGDAFNRRPPTGKWSVAEHVEHLVLSSEPYVDLLRAAIDEARAAGLQHSGGRYRRKLLMRAFIAMLRPPVRMRVKTFPVLEPAEREYDPDEEMARFRDAQAALADTLRSGDGVDLGRVSITSPFVSWMKMPVIQAGEFLLAHGDRHVWLMREALE